MKRILIILLIIAQHITVWGQSDVKLPNKCEVYMPRAILESVVLKESQINEFLKDPYYGQGKESGKVPDSKKYWIVYGDRVNNKTYTTSSGTTVYKEVTWNQPVRIARIEGKYALVYSEPNTRVMWPKISDTAEPLGWIPMDRLLLWDSCLADNNGILLKALVCRNVDNTTKNNAGNVGKRYLHPTLQGDPLSLESGVKFYFIMKRDKSGKVLLASQNNMNGVSSSVLYGWVSEDSFIPWNQRSCIEPTWECEDVESLARQGVSAKIYDADGMLASSWPFVIKDGDDEYKYRISPSMLRFPILDGTNETTYECSSFGAQDIENEERKKEFYEKKLNINLTIVIDGTRSMEKYYLPVYNAIQKGCEFFDEQKYNIKVGVVIYRDYHDGSEGLVEILPFKNPNDSKLLEFLQSGGKYGVRSAVGDRTLTEALFYGINTAIDKLKVDSSQSNLMLVIGDCGNADNDTKAPTQKEIEAKLIKNDINLYTFQVQNLDLEAYQKFNDQLGQINKNILQAKYDSLFKGTTVVSKRRKDGFEFYNNARKDEVFKGAELYFGANKSATVGSTIDPEVLTELMRQSLKSYSEVVQYQLNAAIRGEIIPTSKEVKESTGFQQDEAWLRKHGLENSTELLAFRGTTPKYYKDIAYYKPILFITEEEFADLLWRLEPVHQAALTVNSRDRKSYIEALKGLLKSFVPGLTDAQMGEMGLSDITKMIQGLNESSDAMNSEHTLNDIAEKLTAAEFNELVSTFDRKYKMLDHLKHGGYEYRKEFNNTVYYWIPIEYLP